MSHQNEKKGPYSPKNAYEAQPSKTQHTGEEEAYKDLGFGTKIGIKTKRMINKDGSFNVIKKGGGIGAINPYQFLITLPWWQFVFVVLISYIALNTFFALIYLSLDWGQLSGGPITEAGHISPDFLDHFLHAFYFSVQTFTTVGYGTISPVGNAASLVASFEAMIGLMGFALATGVLYGRFSRPSAKIRFSTQAILAPYDGINSFQFRIVNRRANQVVELKVRLVMMRYEQIDGEWKQRFYNLDLERDRVALFPLSWTIVHPIDVNSPLYGEKQESLKASHAEFMVMLSGYDETFAQTVHARTSYKCAELTWGAKFIKIFDNDEDGHLVIQSNRVDDCEFAELNDY